MEWIMNGVKLEKRKLLIALVKAIILMDKEFKNLKNSFHVISKHEKDCMVKYYHTNIYCNYFLLNLVS